MHLLHSGWAAAYAPSKSARCDLSFICSSCKRLIHSHTATTTATSVPLPPSSCHDERSSDANNNNNNESNNNKHRTKRVPIGYWNNLDNQRRFFDDLAKRFSITRLDDWYNIKQQQVVDHGAASLLNQHYRGSLSRALRSIYPEHAWQEWRFPNVPRGFWRDLANQRRFFDEVGRDLGIAHADDWIRITVDQVVSKYRCAGALLNEYYGGSLVRALRTVYPADEHQHDHDHIAPNVVWPVALADAKPRARMGFWRDPRNQRECLDRISRELNVKFPEGWYGVTLAQVRSCRGGRGLLSMHGNSLLRALRAVYPEIAWQSWKFSNCRQSTITPTTTTTTEKGNNTDSNDNDTVVLRDYISAIAKELEIEHLDDWYRVSNRQLQQVGGYHALLRRNGGLYPVLRRLYPEHNWDESKFSSTTTTSASSRPTTTTTTSHRRRSNNNKKASQRMLALVLRRLFPATELFEDYLHPQLLYPDSQQPMELDVYLPSLRLALEYHGEQHYKDNYAFGPSGAYTAKNDAQKRLACERAGITLVSIPYWWDHTAASIAAAIHAVRPDLIPEQAPSPSPELGAKPIA